MKSKHLHFVQLALLVCAIVPFAIAAIVPEGSARAMLCAGGVMLIVVAFLMNILLWQCPACRHVLPPYSLRDIEYCPYYGHPLDAPGE